LSDRLQGIPPKPPSPEALLPAAEHARVAALVREALARQRLSRQALADRAGLSISTLEKALAQRRSFTLATLVRLEQALGVVLREAPAPAAAPPAAEVAPAELGAYARAAVRWIEGRYLTLRPGLRDPATIDAYCTEVHWDAAQCQLRFRESERPDAAFTQQGAVSIPHQSGHIYLVTNVLGQHRLITLGRPTIAGAMHGILATLRAGPGTQLVPIAAPIALLPLGGGAGAPPFGQFAPGQPRHAEYRRSLDRTLGEGFALFLDPAATPGRR
jgi:transcriptional regulator with XRE-family HTH domain